MTPTLPALAALFEKRTPARRKVVVVVVIVVAAAAVHAGPPVFVPPVSAESEAVPDEPVLVPVPEPAALAPSPPLAVEEPVDFDEEEEKEDLRSKQIRAGAGAESGGASAQETSSGLKLFVDFLAEADLAKKSFVFRPNHTYVFVVAQVTDDISFIIHVDTNPVFWELQYEAMPGLSFKVGKIWVPFGTNEFHHLIGGRVDQQSFFLPETWSDYGIAVNWNAIDTEWVNVETTFYAVNGSQGNVADSPAAQEVPTVGAGAAANDNNYSKALGGRAKITLFNDFVVTPSVYFDVWDPDNTYRLLFYSLGFEARRGFIALPWLDRLRLRGEYGRGEIELPFRNLQTDGVIGATGGFAIARVGFYGEATYSIVDTLGFRVRGGRINGDNTKREASDLWMVEPALLWTIAHGKVQLTAAYQFLLPEDLVYDPLVPGDVLYAKVFLQF